MASSTSTKLPKVTEYVRNVGKSVAFASIEAIANNAPGIKDFIKENDEVFTDIYGAVKNYRDTIKKAEKSVRDSNLFKAIEYGTKNIIEDIKTGNFYNDRSKSSEISDAIMGIDDYSSELDFDYEVSSSNNTNSEEYSSDKYLSDSFDRAIGAAAIGNATAVAKGTDMVVKSTRASTTILTGQIERSTATLHSGLGAVYNSINKVNQFLNGPMMAHLDNSRIYYENSLKIMQEQQAMTKELLEMQRNLYNKQESTVRNSKLDQSMNYNGSANLSGYMKTVKNNITNMLDMYNLNMFSGSSMNLPLMIAAQPLKMLLDLVVGPAIIPKNLRKSIESFDGAVTTLFSQFIAKMNKSKNDFTSTGFMDIISNIFGIDIENKSTIKTGNYNKGPVPFDGITRKTIIEVIPGYLARIEAALTGHSERHFDPYKGVWKSIDQIEKDFDAEKMSAIQRANSAINYDLYEYRKGLSKAADEELELSMRKMMTKIFEDGGYFAPSIERDTNAKVDSRGRRKRKSTGDAYREYGFTSKEKFDIFLSQLTDETIRNIANSNMEAKQSYSRKLEDIEKMGGVYNLLFNGSLDGTGAGNNKKLGVSNLNIGHNLLSINKDAYGNNIFYYLREILFNINRRHRIRQHRILKNNKRIGTHNFEYIDDFDNENETSSESEDDPRSSSDDAWSQANEAIEEEERKIAEERAKKKAVGNWIKEKLEKSAVGKYFSKAAGGVSSILAKPMQYAADLLDKADQNLFSMMFGNGEFVDKNGEKITNVFQFMIDNIKKTFEDLGKWIKTQLGKIFNPIWEKIKPKVQPVIDELKDMGKVAGSRIKRGFDNTFGKAFNSAIQKVTRGNVASADEVEGTASEKDINDPGVITENAFGTRFVTKRGLTMISPGEMIIPASDDDNELNKMLSAEKKDKNRILNAMRINSEDIGLNAKGNVDTEDFKKKLYDIWNENKSDKKTAKIGAGGIVGAGASLLTGINPLLGAIAGAGISILNNSKTLQNIVFGEEINGERKGGIIPKKIQDIFSEALPDMGDYGIAGGVLGLLTPFGPLGGAAIGAGIGYLKNSESFKKFIFGDEATGEEGFIKKESFDKFKEHLKKAAPSMLIGAGASILAGPFGLLGNAVMGAGLGLLSTTDEFKHFIFGNPEEGTAGVLDAFKTGLLDPAKDKLIEFTADFKEYAKNNILEPMKNFWKPVTQMLKNIIQTTGDKIKDHINDMLDRTLGQPMHDFLQEKIFKPVGKIIFGILKAPVAIGKAVVAAPFRMLGGIGNSIRASQIRRGTAYDMSASERLAWRKQHDIRFNPTSLFRDKTKEQDELLSNMNVSDLESIMTNAKVGLDSYSKLQEQTRNIKTGISNDISGFFNTKDENNKTRFNRVNIKFVDKLTKIAQNGDLDKANSYIDTMKGLSDKEKDELKKRIEDKVLAASRADKTMKAANKSSDELDAEMSKLIGRKFKNRKDRRQLYRSAEAELKARKNAEEKEKESPEENSINNFAEIYQEKTKTIIEELITANKYLKHLVDPEADENDTTPEGDAKSKEESKINSEVESDGASTDTSSIDDAVSVIKNKNDDESKSEVLDEDSKEAKQTRDEAKEEKIKDEKQVEANETSASVLTSIKDFLMGNKKDKDGKTGFLGKLMSGLGKVGKFLGIAGLSLTGVSLFGHASEWFRTSIWPKINETLFGTTKSDGTTTKGLLGGFGDRLKNLVNGEDGKSGIVGGIKKLLFGNSDTGEKGLVDKIGNWFGTKIDGIVDWFKSKGGLSGIILNRIVPGFINGLGYAINNLVAPITGMMLRALPSLLVGLGKALLEGIRMAVFNKELPNNRISINDAGAARAIDKMQDAVNSSIASNDKTGTVTNIRASFGNLKSAAFSDEYSIDMGTIFDKNSNINNERSNSIYGLLGQTSRTNKIEYDENGNIITDYTRWNTTDSLLSKGVEVAGRNFRKGLAGDIASKAASETVDKAAKKAASSATDDAIKGISKLLAPGGKISGFIDILKSGFKGSKKIVGNAGKLGTKIHDKLGKANINDLDPNADTVVKESIDDVVENAADNIPETAVKEGIDNVVENAVENMPETAVKEGIDDVVENTVDDVVKNAADNIPETAVKEGIDNVVVNAVDDAVKNATDNISETAVKEGIDNVIESAVDDAVKNAVDDIPETAVKEGIDNIVGNAVDNIPETVVKEGIDNVVGNAVDDAVKNAVDGMGNKTIQNTILDNVDNVGAQILDNGSGAVAASVTENVVKNVADDAVEAAAKTGILSGVKNIFKNICGCKFVKKIAECASKMTSKAVTEEVVKKAITAIGEKLGNSLISRAAKGALTGIGNVISKFSPLTLITFAIDFIWGFDNAYTILGVAKDGSYNVNLAQKCICGLTNLLTNFFTLGIIPADTIMDIVVEYLFPIFGINADKLNAARDEAQSILDEWNNANPNEQYDNLQDYNNKDKWWFKAGKSIKNFFSGGNESDTTDSNSNTRSIGGGNIPDNRNIGGNSINAGFGRKKHSIGMAKKYIPNNGAENIGLVRSADSISTATSNILSTLKSRLKLSNIKNIMKKDYTKIKRALDGNINIFDPKYWNNEKYSNDNLTERMSNIQINMEKLLNSPMIIIRNLLDNVTNTFNDVKKQTVDKLDSLNNNSSINASNTNLTSNSVNSIDSSRSIANNRNMLYGSGHTYQSDRLISNMKYGDSTIGESGCAPVAATNLLNNMGNGIGSVGEAAAYAEKHGMTVPGGGTDIRYFNSYLGSKGIATNNTNSGNRIMDALRNGNQVIMLGQDRNDNPGVPFGTTPHFVTAKGINDNGNIIAEDPDMPEANIEYRPNDVMKSMITSVIADTSGRKRGRTRIDKAKKPTVSINRIRNSVRYGRGTSFGPQAIINIAKSQIGTQENGPNMVKYNDAYYDTHVVNKTQSAYAWCAVFVWWVFNQAGASKLYYGGDKTPSCSTLMSYYKNSGKLDMNPKIGDIVFFNFSGGSSPKHVGIVIDINGNNITSIEGNTGGGNNTNGGCVMERDRKISDIVGFAHPDYPYEYDSTTIVDMSKWGDNTDYEYIAKNGAAMSSSNTSNSTLLTALSNLGTSMVKSMYGADAYEALFGSTNSSTSASSTTGVTSLDGSTDGHKIFNYLRSKGYTPAGAAGVMGNMFAESGLRSNNLQNTYEKSLGMSDSEYTDRVNNKTYSKGSFVNDKAGYGLVQWTYHTLKQGLYESTVEQGKKIDDLGAQLDCLVNQFSTSYPKMNNILKTTNSINEASDTVLDDFERPAKKNYEQRRTYSQNMLDTYGSGRAPTRYRTSSRPNIIYGSGDATRALRMVDNDRTNNTVQTVASAPMIDYASFLKTIIEILISISSNTAMLSKILDILSTKLDINIDKSEITKATNASRDHAEKVLTEMLSKNSNNSSYAKLINNKDTEYLVSAMRAIAGE